MPEQFEPITPEQAQDFVKAVEQGIIQPMTAALERFTELMAQVEPPTVSWPLIEGTFDDDDNP